MVALVVVGAYATALCTVYGLLTLRLLGAVAGPWRSEGGREGAQRKHANESRVSAAATGVAAGIETPIVWIVGACALAASTSWLSLAMPVGAVANALVLCGALAGGWALRRELAARMRAGICAVRAVPWVLWVPVGVVAGRVLLQSLYEPRVADTALYHLQVVAMIEEHPVVPGLANVDDRYGLFSSWFPLEALFHWSWTGLPPFHGLNGIVQLFLAAITVPALARLARGERDAADVFALLMLVPWLGRRTEYSSLGVDLAVGQLTYVCFYLFLRRARAPGQTAGLMVLLPVFALTVKLSAAPLLLFGLWTLAARPRALGWLAALGAALVVPWSARLYLLTGYFVYPLVATGPLNPDWKLPGLVVENGSHGKYALSTARIRDMSPDEVLAMPMSQWVPIWWSRQPLYNQALAFGTIALGLVRAPFALRGRLSWDLLPYGVAAAGLMFWFLTAPDFRFALGLWWCLAALLLGTPLRWLLGRLGRAGLYGLAGALAVWALVYAPLRPDLTELRTHLVFQEGYPTVSAQPHQVGVVTVYAAGQCWYAPRPCTHYLPPGLGTRGPRLEDGFAFPGSG